MLFRATRADGHRTCRARRIRETARRWRDRGWSAESRHTRSRRVENRRTRRVRCDDRSRSRRLSAGDSHSHRRPRNEISHSQRGLRNKVGHRLDRWFGRSRARTGRFPVDIDHRVRRVSSHDIVAHAVGNGEGCTEGSERNQGSH